MHTSYYYVITVISAFDDYKMRPSVTQKYDQHLRQVREMQQLQAEKEARLKALESKNNPQPTEKPIIIKKKKETTTKKSNDNGPSLSMQTFAHHTYK